MFSDENRECVLRKLSSAEKLRGFLRRLGRKAQVAPRFRFYVLYDKIHRQDVLQESWRRVRANRGTCGVDGQTIDAIVASGVEPFLQELEHELRSGSYRPQPVRREYIPKPDGRLRPLGIPTVRDRVVQQATLIVLEPIFEADFTESSFGFRPGRSAHQAVDTVVKHLNSGLTEVCDVDIEAYFDSIPHGKLLHLITRRIVDRRVLKLIRQWLKCTVEEKGRRWQPTCGTPQGGVISPLLANIYLHALDATWKKRGYPDPLGPNVQLVRYADDLVLLTDKDAHWAMKRLQEILARLDLRLNEQKSRMVDARKETFDFLGFTFRREWNHRRKQLVTLFYPSKKSQKRLREKLKKVLNAMSPVKLSDRITSTNQILRGWVNYFCIGHSSKVFHKIKWYAEVKIRRLLQRRAKKYGCGWKRYDFDFLHRKLGLYNDYHVRWLPVCA